MYHVDDSCDGARLYAFNSVRTSSVNSIFLPDLNLSDSHHGAHCLQRWRPAIGRFGDTS